MERRAYLPAICDGKFQVSFAGLSQVRGVGMAGSRGIDDVGVACSCLFADAQTVEAPGLRRGGGAGLSAVVSPSHRGSIRQRWCANGGPLREVGTPFDLIAEPSGGGP